MNESERVKELSRIKSQAKSLQSRVLTMKRVTRENANELNRIALEVRSFYFVTILFYVHIIISFCVHFRAHGLTPLPCVAAASLI